MGRLRLLFAALLLCGAVSYSYAQKINDIDITVRLNPDGSGDLSEVWDVEVESGTEWYVPVGNLDRMDIKDFRVYENGVEFVNEGRHWDVDRSAREKAGRCGIVDKGRQGLELCWGQGSYGPHRWTVRYRIEGLVQAYDDYDGFNFMFVNPGMGSGPAHVRVVLENGASDSLWTSGNVRVWGFGHEGEIHVTDGRVVQETSGKMSSDARVITMVRFDKGLFSPAVVNEGPFSDLQDRAMKGSSYGEDDPIEGFIKFVMALAVGAFLFVVVVFPIMIGMGYKYRKSIFGTRKITGWYRDVPLGGNIPAAYYIYKKGCLVSNGQSGILGVYFLKWIMDGVVRVIPDGRNRKRVSLDFSAEAPDFPDSCEKEVYSIAREAAGSNLILETNELNRWSEKNADKFMSIPEKIESAGFGWLADRRYMEGLTRCSEAGKAEARRVIEFRNFLKDFTLSRERGAEEVALWKEYLVYAQLFGIADKVAKQFRKLYPEQFGQLADECGLNDWMLYYFIINNNRVTQEAFVRATATKAEAAGMGGHTSFGGGGGFSGGGFGGGSR